MSIKQYVDLYKTGLYRAEKILRLMELDLEAKKAKTEEKKAAIYKKELMMLL